MLPARALNALFASTLCLVPALALARAQGDVAYPYAQVWNATLRMVRVDMRMPVTDRDVDAGYLLFDYVDHGKRYPGSVELVRDERQNRPATKIVIQVPGMPGYVEQMLLGKLTQKLRAEYGEPLAPPKPPAEKPKPEPPKETPPKDEVPEPPVHDGLAPDT